MPIYAECDPDTVLVRTFGFKEVKHVAGGARVIREVHRREGAVGMLDEDPGKSHPRKLDLFEERGHEEDLILREWRGRRLVLVSPEIEEWVLKTAAIEHVDVTDRRYGLPSDPDELRKVMAGSLDRWRLLVDDLKGTRRMALLRSWLSVR